jgi:hypothetical protein
MEHMPYTRNQPQRTLRSLEPAAAASCFARAVQAPEQADLSARYRRPRVYNCFK